ncbi:MAG: hypothetical protein IKW64_02630 [Clostridia bacterium]|nr:hypothetical protein [Clostridia bacterium]
MKYIGFVITYAPEDGINKQNYFINGTVKEDICETGCAEMFNSPRRRNLLGVIDASPSEISGDETAFLCATALEECLGLDFDATYSNFFTAVNEIAKGRAFQAGGKFVCVNTGILFFQNEYCKVYNAGDVPVYHFRDKKLKNYAGKMPKTVEREEMIDNDGEVEVKKCVKNTAPYIGFISDELVVEPYISPKIKIKNKDIFLITTQSVRDVVGEKAIAQILSNDKLKIDEKAEAIVDAAAEKNPDGNFTVQIVVAKDSVRFVGVKLGYIFTAVIVALCIVVSSMFGESINKGAQILVNSWRIIVNSFTYRDIKPDVVADPWVPLGRDEEEEDQKKKAEEEARKAKEAEEEQKRAKEEAEQQKASRPAPVQKRPSTPAQSQPAVQSKPASSNAEGNTENALEGENAQASVPAVETPVVTKPDLPPVKENDEVELPIDFN